MACTLGGLPLQPVRRMRASRMPTAARLHRSVTFQLSSAAAPVGVHPEGCTTCHQQTRQQHPPLSLTPVLPCRPQPKSLLPQNEVVSILQQQAKIEPSFTQLVWQKLEEQNLEFFR